jgi:phosphoserine aminotransferase
MPPRESVVYFGPGPAPLPTPVLQRASEALLNYKDKGIGLCEISHRSPEANEILAHAKTALSTLLDFSQDEYEILFVHGGGSGEFSAVAYHAVSAWVGRRWARAAKELGVEDTSGVDEKVLERVRKEAKEELRLDYLVTGSWSLKASQEAARLMGAEYVNVAVDARKSNDGKFGKIPAESEWNLTKTGSGPALVYYCDNETVDGVEFPGFPKVLENMGNETIIAADMSSNFISRRVPVSNFGVIFGGAQKNVGSTGITLLIVRKSFMPPAAPLATAAQLRALQLSVGPIVFDWPTLAKANSLYNTLPIFDVWIAGQVVDSLNQKYGELRIAGQEEVSGEKSKLVYEVLDRYPQLYRVVPDKSVRSRMNICFRVHGGDADKEKEFLAGAEKRGLLGLKGHRSVGGIRVSSYNAVSVDGVKKLVAYLEDYADGQQ